MGGKILAQSRPVCLAVLRVQVVPASGPRELPSLQLSAEHLALVSLAQMAQAKDQAVVPQALPSLQVFPLPRALVSFAQTVQASHRPELLSRLEAVV
jgi:hypothetical protein